MVKNPLISSPILRFCTRNGSKWLSQYLLMFAGHIMQLDALSSCVAFCCLCSCEMKMGAAALCLPIVWAVGVGCWILAMWWCYSCFVFLVALSGCWKWLKVCPLKWLSPLSLSALQGVGVGIRVCFSSGLLPVSEMV